MCVLWHFSIELLFQNAHWLSISQLLQPTKMCMHTEIRNLTPLIISDISGNCFISITHICWSFWKNIMQCKYTSDIGSKPYETFYVFVKTWLIILSKIISIKSTPKDIQRIHYLNYKIVETIIQPSGARFNLHKWTILK